jgi:hypothetical protein
LARGPSYLGPDVKSVGVCDKIVGKRSVSPHPHSAFPLNGRENRERSLKGMENSERLRPKEGESIGFLPLQGGGRRR